MTMTVVMEAMNRTVRYEPAVKASFNASMDTVLQHHSS